MTIKTLETNIDIKHIDKLKIFLEANDLRSVHVAKYDKWVSEQLILEEVAVSYDEDNIDDTSKLMFMALRHCGVENMLEDYLMKVGVDPIALSPYIPPSISKTLTKV